MKQEYFSMQPGETMGEGGQSTENKDSGCIKRIAVILESKKIICKLSIWEIESLGV